MPRTVQTLGYDADREVDALWREIEALKRQQPDRPKSAVAQEALIPITGITVQKVGGDPSFETDGVEFGEGFAVSRNEQNGFGHIDYTPPTTSQELYIGETVQGGVGKSLLFVSDEGQLAQDEWNLVYDPATVRMRIGGAVSGAPDKPLYVTEDTADTTTALSVIEVMRRSSGTIGGQFGSGISFAIQESGGSQLQAGAVVARYNDNGSGPANDFKLEFYTMKAGSIIDTAYIDGSGNLVLLVAGGGLSVKEGTNACMGVATLVAGTVTVSTAKVTNNSRILLTGQNSSGTHGELTVSGRTVGTSFTITSSNGADTRQVAWMIVEPA